jgi:hypothetical protein
MIVRLADVPLDPLVRRVIAGGGVAEAFGPAKVGNFCGLKKSTRGVTLAPSVRGRR